MRAFILNLLLFLLPLGIFFTPACVVLFMSGEFTPLASIGALSRSANHVIVGPAYNNFRDAYQLQEVSIRRPEITALGSSRVGQFRAVFFKDPNFFYNASGSIGALSEFADFLKHLPEPPRIVIAGMDHYFFKPENAGNNVTMRPDPFTVPVQTYDPFFESFFRNGGWWKIYADYFSGKFKFADFFAPSRETIQTIGLRALSNESGFTNDGSNYNAKSTRQEAFQSIDTLAKSITSIEGDEYGNGISTDALHELQMFLTFAREQNITVIGFLPPVAHTVYQELEKHPDAHYAYAFKNLGSVLASLYKKYGFDFYDFSDITSFRSSDSEMVEAKHGGEKMYLRILIQMAEQNSSLRPFVDIPYLKERLANATSSYYVFGITAD